jgi:beta,beta-carotene 9',10'-dioxygenase
MNHFFDGLSCVHKYEIKNGNVFYFNKLLKTTAYKKTFEENRFGIGSYGTPDLCSSLFGNLKTLYHGTHEGRDNTNVNIQPFANRQMYALTETDFLNRVDPQTLEIIEKLNVKDKITTSNTIIAHPHVLPDGSWIDMGVNLSNRLKPAYDFVHYDGNGLKDPKLSNILENGKLINTVQSSTPKGFSYFHSFALSQNYIIFLEQSLKLNMVSRLTGLIRKRPIADCFYMEPKFNTRIHLINRNTGQLVEQKFHTDPTFSYHFINSYERLNVILNLLYKNFFFGLRSIAFISLSKHIQITSE